MPATQSGFRRGHSAETATTRFPSGLLQAVDRGDSAAMTMLDLTAALDTVDHQILLERLRISCRIDGQALSPFQSYLDGTCAAAVCVLPSAVCHLLCPQWSVLGPVLFIIYASDL
jgi:Reverse transcriptase (RNA-dependent DNA polymerase)